MLEGNYDNNRSAFQFTHPGRGATTMEAAEINRTIVSIHAPREGCDDTTRYSKQQPKMFQFTHPGRGTTFGKSQA